jgi:hypothetical protein
MKETLTLVLSRHQAKVLNGALAFVNRFYKLAPNEPLYHIPSEGISGDLVQAEFLLLHEAVIRQFKEQDRESS